MTHPVIVIGGGAAGFFAAIHAAETGKAVLLLERSQNLLSKVLVSGGGRCNVTHNQPDPGLLAANYPRGGKFLKQAFYRFNPVHTIRWFEERGVALKTEADGRMFPVTDNSETIAGCLLREARELKVEIRTGCKVTGIEPGNGSFLIHTDTQTLACSQLIIATGGGPKAEHYDWLRTLDLEIVPPVPSLFTLNLPQSPLRSLLGVSVPNARIHLAGKPKQAQQGPLLITHWGLSGPAVLRLSAWMARELAEIQYKTDILINWLPEVTEDSLRNHFAEQRQNHGKKLVKNTRPVELPERLWLHLLEKSDISETTTWAELNKIQAGKLMQYLLQYPEQMQGKTTFKEEFVTCGGISLKEINPDMESKRWPGLFFCGEVLDIDGITGGFNFQAAWTGGFLAGTKAGKA